MKNAAAIADMPQCSDNSLPVRPYLYNPTLFIDQPLSGGCFVGFLGPKTWKANRRSTRGRSKMTLNN